MTEEELKNYIRCNLSISINYDSFYNEIKVKIMIGNENISEDTVFLPFVD